jgi:hypothetical protein
MNRRFSRIALATVFAGAAIAVAPAAAAADTVTLGSPLVSNYDGGVSTGTNLTAQISFDPATSTNPVVSPANGVITGWKMKSADDGAVYTLKVLRPNGPISLVPATTTNFSAIASVQAPSAVPNGTFAATPTGVIFDYPASLPISKGDYLGVRSVGGPGAHGLPQAMANGMPLSAFGNNFGGQPADGTSADLITDVQHELLLQATVKFCKVPDLTGLKLADAQSKLAAADCASTVTKKKLKKSKKTKKKKGKVLSQSLPADTTAAPGTAVAIKVAKLIKPKK